MRRTVREIAGLFGETFHRCVLHSADTQSAAIAFYSLFALAPLLLVVLSIARRSLAEGPALAEIARQVEGFAGPDAARAVAALVGKAAESRLGAGSPGAAAIAVLLLGATAVFLQLQEALNRVWEVAPQPGSVFRALLKKRLVSFGLVLMVGVLLLVSLLLSAGLMALLGDPAAALPLRLVLFTLGNEVLTFLVLAVLLALTYRVLPDAKLEWRDVGLGAVVTSLLFTIGKWLIGFPLGRATAASRFGAAGSLVVVLLWVYYESFLLLFGAELTAVFSSHYGRHPVTPEAGATRAGAGPGQKPALRPGTNRAE